MTMQSVGFLGGGRVARILIAGWRRADRCPREIVVFDTEAKALERLRHEAGALFMAAAEAEATAACDLVIVALHPPGVEPALEAIRPVLRPSAVVLSLAPKVDLERMSRALGGFDRLARMIPNAPSIVGAGFNPITCSPSLGEGERRWLRELFEPLGECPEVAEEELEAYAVLSAMGPTYLWFQLDTLKNLGVDFGLTQEAAARATAAMARGAVDALFQAGREPGEVMDLIPVRPLAESEPDIQALYRNKLAALYGKLRGVAPVA